MEATDHCEYEIELLPETATVEAGEVVQFQGTVKPEPPNPHFFDVSISSHGELGTVEVTDEGLVIYTAEPDAENGTDEIEFFVRTQNADPTLGKLIGSAKSTVEVHRRPYQVAVDPAASTIGWGETEFFSITLDGMAPGPESFRWSSTEFYGALLPESGTISPSALASYMAYADVEGTEPVVVEVLDADMNVVGAASAEVRVERPPPQMIFGTFELE